MSRLALYVLAAIVVAVTGGGWLAWRTLNEPMNLPATGHVLVVPPGASLQSMMSTLESGDILENAVLVTALGRLTGQASMIRAGEYDIVPGTTPRGLLQQLVEGRVKLHALTIVEGWTTRDLLRAIRKNGAIRHTLEPGEDERLGSVLGLPTPHPEGWFFPDTYRFPRGTTDREVLSMAHERMRVMLDKAWARRQEGLPIDNAYEALVLASIIEKETALDRERVRIAGVFSRRLLTGMRLQTDPTVIYGLGTDFDGDLTRRHLERDTPYNTYTRDGLPPTPIALPGEASLLAAVQPDDAKALYFVASGDEDGGHVFSATLREHNAAVKRYLDASRKNRE